MWIFVILCRIINLSSLKSYKDKLVIHYILMYIAIKTINSSNIDKDRWEELTWWHGLCFTLFCIPYEKFMKTDDRVLIQISTLSSDG